MEDMQDIIKISKLDYVEEISDDDISVILHNYETKSFNVVKTINNEIEKGLIAFNERLKEVLLNKSDKKEMYEFIKELYKSDNQTRDILLKNNINVEYSEIDGKYLDANGVIKEDEKYKSIITNKIYCSEGWVFQYEGESIEESISYVLLKDDNIIKSIKVNNSIDQIIIPEGVNNAIFVSSGAKSNNLTLNISLLKPDIVINDNLKDKLFNNIDIYDIADKFKDYFYFTEKKINVDEIKKIDNSILTITGDLKEERGFNVYELDVNYGEIYKLSCAVVYDIAPYHLLDKDDNVIIIGGENINHPDLKGFDIEYLNIPKDVVKIRICSGTKMGEAGFCLIKKILNKPLNEDDINDIIDNHIFYDITDYRNITSEFKILDNSSINEKGELIELENSQTTDLIDISNIKEFYMDTYVKENSYAIALYDNIQNFIGNLYSGAIVFNKEKIIMNSLKALYPTLMYLRICSYDLENHPISIYEKEATMKELTSYLNDKMNKIDSANILSNKKWVVCGDGFTAGNFTGYVDENGLSGKDSPYLYDKELKCYKTFPWWISKRNNMNLINKSICSSTMAISEEYMNGEYDDIIYRHPFSLTRYKEVPLDADYLTLCFGTNESLTPIGTLSDTTNNTIIGAWNIVLEYFLTNMPFTKIGIIISSNVLSDEVASAIIRVSEYWGIPYLDMRNNPQVPLMTNGRGEKIELNPKALKLRNKAFCVSDTNTYPNIEAHKYQSTFIENWLKSL